MASKLRGFSTTMRVLVVPKVPKTLDRQLYHPVGREPFWVSVIHSAVLCEFRTIIFVSTEEDAEAIRQDWAP